LVIKDRQLDRECISGAIILVCIILVILSVVTIRLLDVRILNIELVDRGLFTVITDKGPINVSQDEILRIERTYPKAAITGEIIEQDRIYTTKGFIFLTSLDPFYSTGRNMINSVDLEGKSVWIKYDKNEATESQLSRNQMLNNNLKTVKPYSYAIGTPRKLIPLVHFVVTIQYLALTIGGISLIILIFPLRLAKPIPDQPLIQEDQEYCSSEEAIKVIAK
jgi:hypothetical protein